MDLRESEWFQLQCRRAARAAGELIFYRIARQNRGPAQQEMERLVREERMALERFNAANEADGEAEAVPEPISCPWCGVDVDELLHDASKIERPPGKEYEAEMICLGCFDMECEKEDTRFGECSDFSEEVGS